MRIRVFFFFKQTTAYEMRISDWSSDVCSSDLEGHNYFRSKNPYKLRSYAFFGESYLNITDDLKLTAGLRYTDDRKTFTPVPSQTLLSPGLTGGGTVSRGYPEKPAIVQQWGEFTGRIGLDWAPDLRSEEPTSELQS